MGIGSEETPICFPASAVPQHVLMLPGLDGSSRLSPPFLSALQAYGLTTQAITLPAQGPQDHATLAQRLWSQLPSRPFILLAESFSGPLAVELATRHPTGLRGLVLAATFARRPVPLPAASAALLSPAWPLPPVALLARLLLGPWYTRGHTSMLRDALARTPTSTLRQRAAATLRVDVRALLPAIQVPTLCLHACHDRLLWPPSVAELQALLPDARHVSLEGPHLLLQARADAAAAEVAAWMRTLPR
ncbi:alpha/beta fold hydrolase [Stenotrophomonas sp. 22692]|uniref:serine aminopeptidase domain-containing protein n=1 Tax=Stenotrophomonas TaxID=40323 RepID=UPI00066C95AA|nr:alpha/beta hydrolase [Stenotrophomonas geniculata]MCF3476089.1 alpha/beta hydrolase [Stenotrophomonas maltophilia]MCI1067524.1 alpha/beta hydrolase [Stenotrophomonas maltophilia]MCI1092839.1 alpha/beta hydrolase [Stenotrophomonas maltophilia]MCI1103415.1 alpha/beta hydrolase [Stenotrophomonas maltophilia]MCI1108644.1 alpha/beta hydrolase [Stenotrophomonas maltophilia]